MSDMGDSGNDTADLFLHVAIQRKRTEGPKAEGYCLNCFEPIVDDFRRWCDAECRDDWESMNG